MLVQAAAHGIRRESRWWRGALTGYCGRTERMRIRTGVYRLRGLARNIAFLLAGAAILLGAALWVVGFHALRQVPRSEPVCPYSHQWCVRDGGDGVGNEGTYEQVMADRRAEQDIAFQTLLLGVVPLGGGLATMLVLMLLGRRPTPKPTLATQAPTERPNAHRHPPVSPAPTPTHPPDDYRLLLLMSGSHATAESLIAFERKQLPGADRAALIAKAIERLRRDRDRQG